MNDNAPTKYPYWSCMGCCALNSTNYDTCFRCNMTMEDSEALYKQEINRRTDPRPPREDTISDSTLPLPYTDAVHNSRMRKATLEAHRTFDALPVATEYAEPYNPSNAELLHKLRMSRLRRHLWAAVKAFWQGVFGALVFIGWCMLVAFAVMGVLSLFIH